MSNSSKPCAPRLASSAQALHVLKFGGTSVGAPDTLRQVVEIVARQARVSRVVVVASAAAGVTNDLVQAVETVAGGTHAPDAWLERLEERHESLASAVLSQEAMPAYRLFVRVHLAALERTLHRIASGPTLALRDEALAAGERLSVPLVAAALKAAGARAEPIDATHLIRTDAEHGSARVLREPTERQVRAWFDGLHPEAAPVVTGFIGATEAGAVTTLGRGGSDYTAALLAAALRADVFERWTDIDGLYTDDPRHNEDAQRLACLALDEANAWNQAGRLGMHPDALTPLLKAGIPLHVRSTRTPDVAGTWLLPVGVPWAKAC